MSHLNLISKSIFMAMTAAGILSFGITAQAATTGSDQATGTAQQSSAAQSSQGTQETNGSNASATQPGSNTAQTQGPGSKIIFVQKASQVLASSIMGMSIQNGTGKDATQIGTINDLIMNKQHQLVGIVVGVGGFLGIGQKNVGIPWSEVKDINTAKDVAVVDVTKKELTQAPEFTTKQEKKQQEKQQKLLQKQRQESEKKLKQQQKAQDLMQQKMPQGQESQ